MSCSLEARAPFLDRDIVEFGLKLNEEYKINKGINKWILRDFKNIFHLMILKDQKLVLQFL